jgi:hypothetical protein
MENPFLASLRALHKAAWREEFPKATASTYTSKVKKWQAFCRNAGFSPLAAPTQLQAELYITWLAHSAKNGSPMARDSVKQYVGRLAIVIDQDHPEAFNAFRTLQSARFLKLTLRRMPKNKQRARPLSVAHLAALRAAASGLFSPTGAQAAIFIALLAFWGCLRLCTIFGDAKVGLLPMSWANISRSSGALLVGVFRDKTILSPDEAHLLRLPSLPQQREICPVEALSLLQAEWAGDRFCPSPSDSITIFGPGATDRITCESLLKMLNTAVPPAPASSGLKSHFTKHSFRRGHVQACLRAGIDLNDIMLYGNWRSVPSVRNYAQGATHCSSLSLRIGT